MPPYAASTDFVRLRVLEPTPMVVVHVDHSPHSVNSQFTGSKNGRINVLMNRKIISILGLLLNFMNNIRFCISTFLKTGFYIIRRIQNEFVVFVAWIFAPPAAVSIFKYPWSWKVQLLIRSTFNGFTIGIIFTFFHAWNTTRNIISTFIKIKVPINSLCELLPTTFVMGTLEKILFAGCIVLDS